MVSLLSNCHLHSMTGCYISLFYFLSYITRFREIQQGSSEKNCKGKRSYGTVWKDLEKQEYQHGNQNKHIKSDIDERGNVICPVLCGNASETWTLKKKDRGRLLAFEMKCYRIILRIRWKQKITNEEVRRRVRCKKNIIQQIMERKLNLLGQDEG